MAFNNPQEVLGAIARAYYAERSVEATLSCVTDDIEWIGTETNDRITGKAELKILLENDFASFPDQVSTELDAPVIQYLGSNAAVLTITGKQLATPGSTIGLPIRGTISCVNTDKGWLVANGHTSMPSAELEKLSLLNTVPAGIGIFEIDKEGLTQLYLNDAFYGLIGSTRKARRNYFGRNTLQSSHPADNSKLQDAVKRLLEGEDSVELDYRVKGDDGHWHWLHLVTSVVQRTSQSIKVYAAFYECTKAIQQNINLMQNHKAIELAQKKGGLAIWTYNIDQGILIQQTASEDIGYSGYPVHISGVPQYFVDNNCVHPEDIDIFLEAYNQLAAGEERVDALYRLMDKNTGKYNWIHMFYRSTGENDDGDRMSVGFSLVVNREQEAIEQYRVEQKLREQMYASASIYMEYNLTKNTYAGENNLAEQYRSVSWEDPTLEKYRANMSTVAEEPYLDEIVNKMYTEHLLQAFENGETKVSCEYRSKERHDMPSTWYRVSATMVKRPDTGDVMAFVYVENIEIEKNRQLAIQNSMSDGIESVTIIRVIDRQAHIIGINNSYLPLQQNMNFVYDDNFVARAHKAVIPDENDSREDAATLSTILKELQTQEVYQYSITTQMEGKAPRRQLFRFRYLDDRKTNIIMSISDITAVYVEDLQKKKQLESALHDLQKASHAKAEFYSRMSHDMRTPMNGILGMAKLSEDVTDSDKLKENIGKIKESGEYLLSLINDTLDLQRIESGKMTLEPTIVNATDMVTNINDMVSITAKAKGVNLKYSSDNADLHWSIRIDALRLKQIFINLLSNAIKFTPSGGTVEIEFKLINREDMISHDVVYVRDTGVGMSQEFLENGIFKPFSQENNAVSANYAGSGLGLSIAKSLIELMGGTIEVESELGVGTTFAVHLDFERVDPEEAREARRSEKKQSKNVLAQLKGIHILLAEDHPLNAEIAKKLLEKVGCVVTWVKNGQEAVDCFTTSSAHDFDVVLMDIRMPVMDGLEATKKIRALNNPHAQTVPIIAMTANAYEEDMKASLDAGMNAHLGKPIETKALYDTLAQYTNTTKSFK